jgi:hypothetical protein
VSEQGDLSEYLPKFHKSADISFVAQECGIVSICNRCKNGMGEVKLLSVRRYGIDSDVSWPRKWRFFTWWQESGEPRICASSVQGGKYTQRTKNELMIFEHISRSRYCLGISSCTIMRKGVHNLTSELNLH